MSCAPPDIDPAANIFRTLSSVSASAADLSGRYRFTRAKRSASPSGYRGLI